MFPCGNNANRFDAASPQINADLRLHSINASAVPSRKSEPTDLFPYDGHLVRPTL